VKRVVLVRTQGPRNAGMALRAAANFGPAEVWFVAPARPSLLIHPEFEQMGHGVENLRERAVVVGTLEEALADCTSSVGFTARVRGSRWRKDWRKARESVLEACRDPGQRVALVFGSEENGLTAEEVALCRELCYLPTSSEHTSVNLAMAVGIVLSSLFEGRGVHQHERGTRLVDGAGLAYLKEHLKQVLGGQVARGAAARRDIERSIERVFSRAPIESRDARAWHMMMRALGSRATPADLGVAGSEKELRRKQALERARVRAAGARSNESIRGVEPVEGSRPRKGRTPTAGSRSARGSGS
jgi:tRNA/rRNA methyltransferase